MEKCATCKWMQLEKHWCFKAGFLVSPWCMEYEPPPACPGYEPAIGQGHRERQARKSKKEVTLRLPVA